MTNANNEIEKDKDLSFGIAFLMNFALIVSIMYMIAIIPYAFIRNLLPNYFYPIFFISFIIYLIYWLWVIKNRNIRGSETII